MAMSLKKLLTIELDLVVGIIAAVAALLMHRLHMVDDDVLISLTVILIAILFMRDLRRDQTHEKMNASIEANRDVLQSIQAGLVSPDVILVGPSQLREASQQFTARARGDMTWFHVCLSMFRHTLNSLLTWLKWNAITALKNDSGDRGHVSHCCHAVAIIMS